MGARRFDVAIWRAWPSSDLPVVALAEAPDAAAAVVQVMRARGWTWAGYVAARDLGGPLLHRAYGVRLVPFVRAKMGQRRVVQLSLIDNLRVMDHK